MKKSHSVIKDFIDRLERGEYSPPITDGLAAKLLKLHRTVENKNVAIAFSGGADSGFLAIFAAAFARRCVVVFFSSQATPTTERENAERIADLYGLDLHILELDFLADEKVVKNTPLRCYFCKKRLMGAFVEWVGKYGEMNGIKFDIITDGTNFSDLGTERPGLKALKEVRIRSLLAESGLAKDDILLVSRILDLPIKDIPSQACLASRIPFNISLNERLLRLVDDAEKTIRKLTSNDSDFLRVRLHLLKPNDTRLARIEAGPNIAAVLMGCNEKEAETRAKIVESLKDLGFTFVTFDLEGFRSGSMHDMLGSK